MIKLCAQPPTLYDTFHIKLIISLVTMTRSYFYYPVYHLNSTIAFF